MDILGDLESKYPGSVRGNFKLKSSVSHLAAFNLTNSTGRVNESLGPLSYTAVFRIVRCFPHSQGTLGICYYA
jgi:hypothetical protein